MNILHLPTSVGGNAWSLSRGERALGYASDVLVSNDTWLKYSADISLNIERKSSVGKLLTLSKTFLELRKKYSVFHFNHGSSLIHSPRNGLFQLDLPYYPDAARIFVTYNGCDIRQKDQVIKQRKIAPCHNPNCYAGVCNDGSLDNWRRIGLEKMEKYAAHIWALNPDLLHFLPEKKSSFLPYAIGGEGFSPVPISKTGRLKILHAPTDRVVKGSDLLFQALDKLTLTHGDCFELILVEGVPNAQALDLYKAADVVVDQLMIGWYGGLAVECMLLGKPVIARIEEQDLCFIDPGMAHDLRDAVINTEPDKIYDTLCWCVENRGELARIAEAGGAYARRWHDPKYVATITTAAYEKN